MTIIAIIGGTVFDARGKPPLPNATVLVEGERIAAVGPAAQIGIPDGAKRIDARGKTVLPGLVDMHVHVRAADSLPLYLAHGVTAMRDVGGDLDDLLRWRRWLREGVIAGPRLFFCGPALDGEPPFNPESVALSGPDDVPPAVDRLTRAGVDGFKCYMRTPPEILRRVVTEAHARGLPVTAHLGLTSAIEAIGMGLDGIEHCAQGAYHHVVRPEDFMHADQRKELGLDVFWARFFAGWARADFEQPGARRLVDLMVEHQTQFTATLVVTEQMTIRRTDDGDDETRGVPTVFSREWRRGMAVFTQKWKDEDYRWAREGMARLKEFVGLVHKSGGNVLAGTDAPIIYVAPGRSLHRELELLVESGLSPAEAIMAATVKPAKALRLDREWGTVEAGKLADLAIVDGNPLRRIQDVRKIATVLRGGRQVFGAAG